MSEIQMKSNKHLKESSVKNFFKKKERKRERKKLVLQGVDEGISKLQFNYTLYIGEFFFPGE